MQHEKKYKVNNKIGFVFATSGIFISKKYPRGLVLSEIKAIVFLWNIMERKKTDIITSEVRRILKSSLGMERDTSLYNLISTLKKKGAITADNKLNDVYQNKTVLSIEYEQA